MGRDESTAVNLDLAILADQAELHGEPEQPRHASRVFLVLRRRRDLPVMLQEISEDRVGVERNVTEHVVENVRLGKVIELLPLPDRYGRRKLSEREALKER